MSHPVTITKTTTTTTTIAILNTDYLKTYPGLLKLAEVILGAVCVGIVAFYTSSHILFPVCFAERVFLLMATSFLIATTCLFLSCLLSMSTASVIMETVYETLYHFVGFIFLLAASLNCLVIFMNNESTYKPNFVAVAIGLVNSALYLQSAIVGYENYRILYNIEKK